MIRRQGSLTLIVFPWVMFVVIFSGCAGPEDGRARGSGPGGDGGNYRDKPIHAPSKIDGTKQVPDPFPTR